MAVSDFEAYPNEGIVFHTWTFWEDRSSIKTEDDEPTSLVGNRLEG